MQCTMPCTTQALSETIIEESGPEDERLQAIHHRLPVLTVTGSRPAQYSLLQAPDQRGTHDYRLQTSAVLMVAGCSTYGCRPQHVRLHGCRRSTIGWTSSIRLAPSRAHARSSRASVRFILHYVTYCITYRLAYCVTCCAAHSITHCITYCITHCMTECIT